MKILNRIREWIRYYVCWNRVIVHGFCPECNSDAPKLYDCPVCNYSTGSPFNRTRRKELWDAWKKLNVKNEGE